MSDDEPIPQPSAAMVDIAPGVCAAEKALRLQFARGGGPGGQNVNKLNTKVELWVQLSGIEGMNESALRRLAQLAGHRLTRANEIHLSSNAERSQQANRQDVFQRLREMVILAKIAPKRRRKTKPSRASKERRLEGKRRRSEIKSRRRDV
jgi:ribosome-associated protein